MQTGKSKQDKQATMQIIPTEVLKKTAKKITKSEENEKGPNGGRRAKSSYRYILQIYLHVYLHMLERFVNQGGLDHEHSS